MLLDQTFIQLLHRLPPSYDDPPVQCINCGIDSEVLESLDVLHLGHAPRGQQVGESLAASEVMVQQGFFLFLQ